MSVPPKTLLHRAFQLGHFLDAADVDGRCHDIGAAGR